MVCTDVWEPHIDFFTYTLNKINDLRMVRFAAAFNTTDIPTELTQPESSLEKNNEVNSV